MTILSVTEKTIGLFSAVLIDAANWLDSTNRSMWRAEGLSTEELLKNYNMEDMKLCYDHGILAGVYILQWYDALFWPELSKDESGFIHKLAVSNEFRNQGYGRKLLESAEDICKIHGVNSLRLNCGTARLSLRSFYERAGFQMVDRVFINQRDQIRYMKVLG